MSSAFEWHLYFGVDSIGDYISCGASSVVLSDAIFNKEAMAQQNFNTISQLASVAALQGKEAVLRWGFSTIYFIWIAIISTFQQ